MGPAIPPHRRVAIGSPVELPNDTAFTRQKLPWPQNQFAEVEKCATSSYVLARRGLPSDTGTMAELREAAVSALGAGRVESALQSYRELERQDDAVPVWSLRVAECYRRLGRLEGELSALMRAAYRYERRGFLNEALALWSRISTRDPADETARLAVARLDHCCDRGLDRLRSSLPPASEPPRSASAGMLRSGVVPAVGVAVPSIPREPRVPDFELPEPAGAAAPSGDERPRADGQAAPEAPPRAGHLDPNASPSAAPAGPDARATEPRTPPSSARLRRSVLVPPRPVAGALPVGLATRRTPPMPLAAPAPHDEQLPAITPTPIIGIGNVAPTPSRRAATVAINPPPAGAPAPRGGSSARAGGDGATPSILPARIIAVDAGADEATATIEYLEPELCPFLEDIDAGW